MKTSINTRSKLTKFIVAASLLALSGIGATAQAHEPTTAPTTQWAVTSPVRYSDLDISTAKGAKTLYLRIRYTAETLCQSAATWGKKEADACITKAVNDAVAGVNAPLLTEYSQLRSKGEKTGPVQLANAN